jgi:hypothetical protein
MYTSVIMEVWIIFSSHCRVLLFCPKIPGKLLSSFYKIHPLEYIYRYSEQSSYLLIDSLHRLFDCIIDLVNDTKVSSLMDRRTSTYLYLCYTNLIQKENIMHTETTSTEVMNLCLVLVIIIFRLKDWNLFGQMKTFCLLMSSKKKTICTFLEFFWSPGLNTNINSRKKM